MVLSPHIWRRFHATATIVWMVLIVPSLLWWSESLMWIVFMSLWANIGTHWSAYQASRAEDTESSDSGE